MAGRIAKILTRVRDSLADPDGTRWSDDRLLRLIDEAQIDIAVKNGLLRSKAQIAITLDINTYDLGDEATKLTRIVNSEGTIVHIRSHAQMDLLDPLWEAATGDTVEFIVFDKQNPGVFKVYPIPTASDTAETFVMTDYGLTTDITDDVLSSDYGVVVDINDTATLLSEFSSIYGVVVDMTAISTTLVVYFEKRPEEIDAIDTGTSQLEIDPIYDKAIKHYVIGMAWRDDQDTQNRLLGKEELEFYAMEFVEARANSSADNLGSNQQSVEYDDGFTQ